MGFTHLWVKSGYSIMNSTIAINKLVEKAKEYQFDAIALTDENVLHGVIPFYKACEAKGIKPIIGMTLTVSYQDELFELILLAKNNHGYQQLLKISTEVMLKEERVIELSALQSYTDNLYGILPMTNKKLIDMLLTETHDYFHTLINGFMHVFSESSFYLGVTADEVGKSIHQALKAYHDAYLTPIVAVNDVRYLNEKDAVSYDVLQAMKKGKQWEMKLSSKNVVGKYLRSPLEMEQTFLHFWPEILQETEKIKENCHVQLQFHQRLLPSFPVPGGMDAHTYLEKQCWEKVIQRYSAVDERVKQRLSYELEIIQSMGFSDYFLIVADFIQYAKRKNIIVGPGRGSSAGSIVAYVLGITDVDPLKYNLLFERFLNPERQTMPDIDVDFSDERRDEVIEYVREKYGEEHVAQIITFGTFAARSLIRELIKTLNISQEDAAFILKEIPKDAKITLATTLKQSENLQHYIKDSKRLRMLFSIAIKLEGLPRHISTHAAGVIISKEPLTNHVPLTIGSNDTYLTQFAMNDLESIGLLKMDFLGLRNLSLLEKIITSIRYTVDRDFQLSKIPEQDEKTFELLRGAWTNGVFQLESEGMKKVLKQLQPTSFEDIVAVNALFRPGPMDFIPVYIERKHKRRKVTYPHPDLKPILEKTYGVLVYQEQIMQIAHRIAGFSLGEADLLRRAVSKKKKDLMAEQKEAFIKGCLKNGYPIEVAEEIFSWIVKFSNYGFPRSHAVAYSRISYQLSYLKAHYPVNFFVELISTVRGQQEKIHQYWKELKGLNISILPPSINNSFGKYSVEKGNIRMGLSSIKGVGHQAINEIIRVRKEGPFKHLFDFCMRVDPTIVNRQTIENLIMAGCFDELYANRASLLATLDQALETGELFREFRDQPSLFQDTVELDVDYVEIEDFSPMKKLTDEKELMGVYVSSHPLKEIRGLLRANGYISTQNMESLVGKRNVKTVVMIQSLKSIRTKRGDPMAFLVIQDETGEMDAVVFPQIYRDTHHWLKEELTVEIVGKVDLRHDKIQFVIEEMNQFNKSDLQSTEKERLFIKVTRDKQQTALPTIKEIAINYPGSTVVYIYRDDVKKTYRLTSEYFLYTNYECMKKLKDYFGDEHVVLQKKE